MLPRGLHPHGRRLGPSPLGATLELHSPYPRTSCLLRLLHCGWHPGCRVGPYSVLYSATQCRNSYMFQECIAPGSASATPTARDWQTGTVSSRHKARGRWGGAQSHSSFRTQDRLDEQQGA